MADGLTDKPTDGQTVECIYTLSVRPSVRLSVGLPVRWTASPSMGPQATTHLSKGEEICIFASACVEGGEEGVVRLCPSVRDDIVTPRYLLKLGASGITFDDFECLPSLYVRCQNSNKS